MQNQESPEFSLDGPTGGARLPSARADIQPGAFPRRAAALHGEPARTPTVLIIDDNPTALETTRAALEGQGYCVPAANDCSAGFKTIREVEPDLIILDELLMQNSRAGLQLPVEIRKDPKISHIPILITTAANCEQTLERASGVTGNETLPIDGIINKRARQEELRGRVSMLLEMKISKWARKFS